MGVTVRQKQPGQGNSWWIFINHQGKRKAKCVGDKKAAENLASAIRERLKKQEFKLEPDRVVPLFKEYAAKWLDDYVKTCCKETTHAGYDTALRVHIYPAFETRRLPEIGRADVKGFIFSMHKKGLSESTVHHAVACLSGIFSSAVEDGHVAANPAARMGRFIKRGGPKEEIDFLTREEAALFLNAVRKHFPAYYPLFLCSLRTGMRIGEVLALEWGDIDFNGRFIKVRKSLVRGTVTTPKNGKSRKVDMSLQLAEVLKALRLERKKEALRKGQSSVSDQVFMTENGGVIDLSHLRQRVFHKCLEKAGLRRIRIHELRHTYASLLLSQGESLVYVRDQLGHGSIRITVDTYGHLVPGANKGAVDKLDDAGATIRNPGATSDAILGNEQWA